uniref:DNA polymerase epsilon subunit 3 n=1 Tax=Astatotilapia calliptera TaxID=8154 RepID=A0AAX7TY53_ASTCA
MSLHVGRGLIYSSAQKQEEIRPQITSLSVNRLTRPIIFGKYWKAHLLPDGVNVSKEARRAISQAASVFVLYATSCANNFAMKAKRKTLNAGDVLAAMEEMEFERFLEPLREALEVYKQGQKGKKVSEQKRKDKEKKVDTENNKSRDEEGEDDDERMEEEPEVENEAEEEEEVEN